MYNYIDHIVYAVTDLQAAIEDFTNKTGIQVTPGGQHLHHGTHNALVRIGDKTYLEFIAKDPTLSRPADGTWMGLDLIKENKISRWSLSSNRIIEEANIISTYQNNLGIIQEGSRVKSDGSTLQWKMTNVLAKPEVDPVPFLLDWGDSVHPTEGLPIPCAIIDFKVYTNDAAKLSTLYDQLHIHISIAESETNRIELVLGTPKGQIIL